MFSHYESLLRLTAFISVLTVMSLWERRSPRRTLLLGWNRSLNNLALVILDVLSVRYLIPITTVVMAEISDTQGFGLFNILTLGFWPSVILSILLMDLLIYGQHVMMHKIPLLWRLHQVHHTDLDFNVTTAVRFHPVEIIFSTLLKIIFIALLGVPIIAVVLFEIILNISAVFNHSNAYIPVHIDRRLRYFIVTPDMHRVHHSIDNAETNSNYGFNVPWWDRIFSTYRPQPAMGHTRMRLGLKEFKGDKVILLHWLLVQPFISQKATTKH